MSLYPNPKRSVPKDTESDWGYVKNCILQYFYFYLFPYVKSTFLSWTIAKTICFQVLIFSHQVFHSLSKAIFLKSKFDLFSCLETPFDIPFLIRWNPNTSADEFLLLATAYIPRHGHLQPLSPLSFKCIRLLKYLVSCHVLLFPFRRPLLIFIPDEVLIRLQTNPRYYICDTFLNYLSKISISISVWWNSKFRM